MKILSIFVAFLGNMNFKNIDKINTLRKLCVYGIVVNLHGRVGIRPREPHHMIASIVNLGQNVANSDVFGAQIVIEKQFSSILYE